MVVVALLVTANSAWKPPGHGLPIVRKVAAQPPGGFVAVVVGGPVVVLVVVVVGGRVVVVVVGGVVDWNWVKKSHVRAGSQVWGFSPWDPSAGAGLCPSS